MDLSTLLNNFNSITETPENFMNVQASHSNEIKSFVKCTYDFIKNEEEKANKINSLPELIVENFDLEQIWQQLELQNEELFNKSLTSVPKFAVSKDRLFFQETQIEDLPTDEETNVEDTDEETDVEDDKQDEDNSSNKSHSDSEEEELNEDLEISNKFDDKDVNINDNVESTSRFEKRSIVDDEFFKLSEMEEFLKAEEKAMNKESNDDSGNDSESKDEEAEVDFFASGSDADEDEENLHEKNPRYKDFFRSNDEDVSNKRKRFEEEDENSDEASVTDGEQEDSAGDNDNREFKSTLELRQERLKNKIKVLEDGAISEKPWQLHGEVTAENRPINSLLEEVVEFDVTTRPAPVITEQTTLQLEDIIRQRIRDRVFDSVERKERPVDTPLEYKKKLVLNQEKSKESLAQIYEKEYLQQKEVLSGNTEEKEEEEPELHKEVRKMMDALFRQLNAFANLHFTPKAAAPELRIVSNAPAINMEEVAPVAMSDAALLAPEEVKNKIKGDIIGKTERSDTDKNRERRKKKTKQRIHVKEKKKKEDLINKINPGLGNKYSKEKAKRQLEKVTKEKNVDKMDETIDSKSLKSSAAFFKQLEEEVKSQIKVKSQMKNKKNKLNAKKIKL